MQIHELTEPKAALSVKDIIATAKTHSPATITKLLQQLDAADAAAKTEAPKVAPKVANPPPAKAPNYGKQQTYDKTTTNAPVGITPPKAPATATPAALPATAKA
jgi:hypothetical protein